MTKVLIVTNDFPPRSGGIQSFVHALAVRLPADGVVVYAPAWPGAAEFDARQPFPVIRHPGSLMLPLPRVRSRACALLAEHGCDSVLFGAAAPLGLLAPQLRKAGADRIVGLTHGHEAGWAALPGASSLLRRIGNDVDVLTYLAEYFRIRMARALSPDAAGRMVKLTPGVDPMEFRPGAGGMQVRSDLGIPADRPVVVCVSRMVPRKGQDMLIKAWPSVRARTDCDPLLMLIGDGPYRSNLDRLVRETGVADSVLFTGPVCWDDLPSYYDAGNVSRCRAGRAGQASMSRGSASSTSKHPRPACPSSAAIPAARPTPSSRAKPATSSPAAMKRHSPAA